MAKRQIWTPEEDRIIISVIHSSFNTASKIKWAQIASYLKSENPLWNRTGKQCRERWLNHLKPSQDNSDDIRDIDLNKLFNLLRLHGKRWSIIAKELPGQTDNSIKNFFYASIRKGVRNLNVYNNEIRSQRRYKVFEQDLVDKILSVHDEKKKDNLLIADSAVYFLAQQIREKLILISFDDIRAKEVTPTELQATYEGLFESVMQFCRSCKFKKSKSKKAHIGEKKFSIFQRKGLSKEVKIEEELSQEKKSQHTQGRTQKISNSPVKILEEQSNLAKFYPYQEDDQKGEKSKPLIQADMKIEDEYRQDMEFQMSLLRQPEVLIPRHSLFDMLGFSGNNCIEQMPFFF